MFMENLLKIGFLSILNPWLNAIQISEEQFELIDANAYKLENGLLKLIESLEQKRENGEWIDNLIVKECNEIYKIQ